MTIKFSKEDIFRTLFGISAIFITVGIPYSIQETNLTNELEECSFYTIVYPTKFVGSTMSFYYFLNGRKYEDSSRCSADDIGESGFGISKSKAFKEHYLIQISCKDSTNNRVRYEFEIPINLMPPVNGWKYKPSGLNLRERDWLYNTFFRGKYIDWY